MDETGKARTIAKTVGVMTAGFVSWIALRLVFSLVVGAICIALALAVWYPLELVGLRYIGLVAALLVAFGFFFYADRWFDRLTLLRSHR